jgi:hypothetical protein
MVSRLTQQIELAFWDFAIQAMVESPSVQKLLKIAYQVKKYPEKVLALVCASGLMAGFITGMGIFIITINN